MDDLEHHATAYAPTASRPLLGMTLLVVEDSRFASEAIRLLCLRSGARIRRADCLRSARRHLRVYRPSAIVIDLTLPDGSGLDLIRELDAARPRVGIILAISGDDNTESAAIAAGADGFIAKPLTSLAMFQHEILSRMPPDRRPQGTRAVSDERVEPDMIALHDDLEHAAEVLRKSQGERTMRYVAQFIGGVARSADDPSLAVAASELARACSDGGPMIDKVAQIEGLVRQRQQQKRAI